MTKISGLRGAMASRVLPTAGLAHALSMKYLSLRTILVGFRERSPFRQLLDNCGDRREYETFRMRERGRRRWRRRRRRWRRRLRPRAPIRDVARMERVWPRVRAHPPPRAPRRLRRRSPPLSAPLRRRRRRRRPSGGRPCADAVGGGGGRAVGRWSGRSVGRATGRAGDGEVVRSVGLSVGRLSGQWVGWPGGRSVGRWSGRSVGRSIDQSDGLDLFRQGLADGRAAASRPAVGPEKVAGPMQDVSVLGVVRDLRGTRLLDFKRAVDLLMEHEQEDWPLIGPHTLTCELWDARRSRFALDLSRRRRRGS